jgi:hypothetical protein
MVYWAVLGLSATERLPYHDNEWGRPAGRSPACEGCPAERCCGLAGRMVADGGRVLAVWVRALAGWCRGVAGRMDADGVPFLLFGVAALLGSVAALLAG